MEVKSLNRDFVLKTALKVGLEGLSKLNINITESTSETQQAFTTDMVCYVVGSSYLSKVFKLECEKGIIRFDINSLDERLNVEMSFSDKDVEDTLTTILVSFLNRDIIFNRDSSKIYEKENYISQDFINQCLAYCASEPEDNANRREVIDECKE